MGDVVNLNQFRKTQKRKEADAKARDNRAKYGRTGPQKKRDKIESERNAAELDRKKLSRPDTDETDGSPSKS